MAVSERRPKDGNDSAGDGSRCGVALDVSGK